MRYAWGTAFHSKHGARGNSPDHLPGETDPKSDTMSDQLRNNVTADETKHISGQGAK